jgi:DNA-directed RNA polymerase specialized sigma24 family protein
MADEGVTDRRLTDNDPLLRPLLTAADDAERDACIEELVVVEAMPLVRKILSRYSGSDGSISTSDADDVAAEVSWRLVRKLQQLAAGEGEPVRQFPHYVAMLAYNAVYDIFRQQFPERRRLKNRLRYTLLRDTRFDLWMASGGAAAGLKSWRGREPDAGRPVLPEGMRDSTMRNGRRPGDALAALFRAMGTPLLFDELVRLAAELWEVHDVASAHAAPSPPAPPLPAAALESRQALEVLWREILLLRPEQRAALLLNLRDPGQPDIISVLLMAGVATLEAVAEAVGMTVAELGALWSELPLDDLRIAARLGITRQQVINFRQSARFRLARRMAKS